MELDYSENFPCWMGSVPRANACWESIELERMINHIKNGTSILHLAKTHGRTIQDIFFRLKNHCKEFNSYINNEGAAISNERAAITNINLYRISCLDLSFIFKKWDSDGNLIIPIIYSYNSKNNTSIKELKDEFKAENNYTCTLALISSILAVIISIIAIIK